MSPVFIVVVSLLGLFTVATVILIYIVLKVTKETYRHMEDENMPPKKEHPPI